MTIEGFSARGLSDDMQPKALSTNFTNIFTIASAYRPYHYSASVRSMNKSAALHRHLCLIRQLQPPYRYPSKADLMRSLESQGFPTKSIRTVERDFACIRDEYGLEVGFNRRKGGHFLLLPTDEDVSDFTQFIRLLERRERMELVRLSLPKAKAMIHYIQLEYNEQFQGTEHLALLWEALQGQRVVVFTYQSYNADTPKQRTVEPGLQRTVEPGLHFEYRNRWYLDGWDLEAGDVRTFGLDRIRSLVLTDQPVKQDRKVKYPSYRSHAIGVTNRPGLQVETVVLRFQKPEGEYVRSLPLHPSQSIQREDESSIDIALDVILNHELEREILAYGEEVEVIAPLQLREKIAKRTRKMLEKYH
jgi:predicted DNA-binding transcriptional regulator YafY